MHKNIFYQLNWLNSIGIEYYCSDKKSSNLFKKNLQSKKPRVVSQDNNHNILNVESKITVKDRLDKGVKIDNKIDTKSQGKKPRDLAKLSHVMSSSNVIGTSRDLADKAKTVDQLREYVENFHDCELKNLATNTVFGDGNVDANILIIGEAPGATEDQEGIPFCGESGKLLDKMLNTINIERGRNSYITNTVFWRPPANRPPTSEEIGICRPFVEKHIALINPKLIILVGSTAVSSVLGIKEPMSRLRNKTFEYNNKYLSAAISTRIIFHPAYLLRQGIQKKSTWYDLLEIQKLFSSIIDNK